VRRRNRAAVLEDAMVHVVVVAPYFGANMVHCLRCFAALEGVRLGIITAEPRERVPADLPIEGHFQVPNPLDGQQLIVATRAFQSQWGRVDRLEGYLEQLQVPLAVARQALGIDGLHVDAAMRFRDKNLMKATLREAGLPVARQARVHGYEDVRRFVDAVGYPIVMKPLDGAGARGTMRVTSDDELAAALNLLLPSPQRPVQAEEFVRGEEHTCETVCIEGRPVWRSSSFYLPGPLEVMENPWMQYCLLLPREQALPHVQSFLPINAAALSALGLRTGISHMEWFLRADGTPVIGEVGARPPGANIMKTNAAAHDTDMWAAWTRLMVHGTWEIPERRYASGSAFVRAMGRGRQIRSVTGLDALQERIGARVVQAKLPRVGQMRSSHYEGDGWVIVRAPETAEVVEALRAIVTTLEIRC
jgi:hypothetical protein